MSVIAPEVPVAKADMLSRYDDTAKARYAKDACHSAVRDTRGLIDSSSPHGLFASQQTPPSLGWTWPLG
jgi:hypothetical protein